MNGQVNRWVTVLKCSRALKEQTFYCRCMNVEMHESVLTHTNFQKHLQIYTTLDQAY